MIATSVGGTATGKGGDTAIVDDPVSGRTISIPVWVVLEAEKLYLLPVQGSDTRWYKNVLQNPFAPYLSRNFSTTDLTALGTTLHHARGNIRISG
jgi:hypothetical protein